jgi:hypothetical protein
VPDRRPSRKHVLLSVAVGFVVLFGAGVAYQAASRDTDAVTFHGGRYVEPILLTRAQVEHDYGAFQPAGNARIGGRRVFVPVKQATRVRPDIIFLRKDVRTGVLYGLRK